MPGVADAGGSSGEGRLHTNCSHTNNVRHTIAAERDACSEAKHPLSLYRSPKANPTVRGAGAPSVKDCNFDSGKFPNPIPPLEQEEGCGRGGGFGPSLVRSHSKETPRAPQIPIPIRSIHRRAPGLDLVFARASPAGSPLRDAGCLVLGFQPRPRPQIANGESEAGGHTHTHTHKHGKEIKAMQSRPVDSSRTTMKGQTSSAAGRRLRVPADGCGQPLLHRDRQLHCHFRRQTLSARRKVGSGTTMTCTAPTATFANGPGALIHVRRGLLELAHGRREVGVLLHWAVCGCHGEATTTAHVCAIVIRGEGDMRQI
mmetsp:Transcript_1495/g.2697  ORF Transcript_1495/g.2697 Transcript_1495/m.2697 type:complete len:314 (-) Transcript_1495:557-1498(-)